MQKVLLAAALFVGVALISSMPSPRKPLVACGESTLEVIEVRALHHHLAVDAAHFLRANSSQIYGLKNRLSELATNAFVSIAELVEYFGLPVASISYEGPPKFRAQASIVELSLIFDMARALGKTECETQTYVPDINADGVAEAARKLSQAIELLRTEQ